MLAGLGIDILDVARLERELGREDRGFRDAVFSPREIEACGDGPGATRRYAECFAAKEAFFKALGTGWTGGVGFREVEALRDTAGRPSLVLSGRTQQEAERRGLRRTHLAFSHAPRYAMATVLLDS